MGLDFILQVLVSGTVQQMVSDFFSSLTHFSSPKLKFFNFSAFLLSLSLSFVLLTCEGIMLRWKIFWINEKMKKMATKFLPETRGQCSCPGKKLGFQRLTFQVELFSNEKRCYPLQCLSFGFVFSKCISQTMRTAITLILTSTSPHTQTLVALRQAELSKYQNWNVHTSVLISQFARSNKKKINPYFFSSLCILSDARILVVINRIMGCWKILVPIHFLRSTEHFLS